MPHVDEVPLGHVSGKEGNREMLLSMSRNQRAMELELFFYEVLDMEDRSYLASLPVQPSAEYLLRREEIGDQMLLVCPDTSRLLPEEVEEGLANK